MAAAANRGQHRRTTAQATRCLMNWIEYALPMLAGASVTLGLIQCTVWLRNRTQPANLAFALAALAVAAVMLI